MLMSFHIVEQQTNKKNLITWTYPTLSDENERFLLTKTFLHNANFVCLRNRSTYFQIKQQNNCALIIQTNDFDPEKYKLLCDIFMQTYIKCHKNPVELVKLYLNLFTRNCCAFENTELNLISFRSEWHLKDFIQTFQLETILVFNAILLKRRVILCSSNFELLQQELFALTHLVPCRNPSDYLLPLITTIRELKGLSFYVAATTNCDLVQEHKIYDVFVDLDAGEILTSPNSQEIMAMTKMHKDIATFLLKLAENEDLSNFQIKQQISVKISEILDLLQNLGSIHSENGTIITMNDLKSKNYNKNLENFLFNLAIAENLMML